MKVTLNSWFVIINPTSGNGASKNKWREITRLLDVFNFNYQYAFTKYKNHSVKIVQEVIAKNITNIICIGGDGTLHNIVNGIMMQTHMPSHKVKVGVIPIGTGNDWVKTHNISKDISLAIQTIKRGHITQQDIGKIEFLNSSKPIVYFNNIAGIGFDGFVVSKVDKYKHIGSLAYLYGTLASLFSFKNFESKTSFQTKDVTGKTLMVLIGLCKYSGGGMRLTNSPNPFDGFFDISIAKNFSKLDIIKNIGKLFNGNIVFLKKVKCIKANSVKIEVKQKKQPYIQADGELIGKGDINVTLIPKAFSFYC